LEQQVTIMAPEAPQTLQVAQQAFQHFAHGLATGDWQAFIAIFAIKGYCGVVHTKIGWRSPLMCEVTKFELTGNISAAMAESCDFIHYDWLAP
jgi:hypothetical protein